MQGCLERDLEETEDCEMLYDCLSLLSGLTCGLKQGFCLFRLFVFILFCFFVFFI